MVRALQEEVAVPPCCRTDRRACSGRRLAISRHTAQQVAAKSRVVDNHWL